jgi:hypothetical protein
MYIRFCIFTREEDFSPKVRNFVCFHPQDQTKKYLLPGPRRTLAKDHFRGHTPKSVSVPNLDYFLDIHVNTSLVQIHTIVEENIFDTSNVFNTTDRAFTLDVLSGRVSRDYVCDIKKRQAFPNCETLSNLFGYFKTIEKRPDGCLYR